MSLASAGSVAIYTGANSASLSIDTNTISGSTTATTWIHGRAIENVLTTHAYLKEALIESGCTKEQIDEMKTEMIVWIDD
jgi:hypothetical protein